MQLLYIAASLTTSEPEELQEVLAEQDVRISFSSNSYRIRRPQ